jgi:prevent-host-death family protein
MTPATPATSDEAVLHERLLVDVYTSVYTSTVPKTVAVRELRTELARLLDEVVNRREHVVVRRRGQPAAVLIPIDEYDALEETAEILSDAETRHAVDAGLPSWTSGRPSASTMFDASSPHAADRADPRRPEWSWPESSWPESSWPGGRSLSYSASAGL